MGAFTADAASMPLHWIYDQAKLELLLKEVAFMLLLYDRFEYIFPNFYTPFCLASAQSKWR
jgi:hypothetical protein